MRNRTLAKANLYKSCALVWACLSTGYHFHLNHKNGAIYWIMYKTVLYCSNGKQTILLRYKHPLWYCRNSIQVTSRSQLVSKTKQVDFYSNLVKCENIDVAEVEEMLPDRLVWFVSYVNAITRVFSMLYTLSLYESPVYLHFDLFSIYVPRITS